MKQLKKVLQMAVGVVSVTAIALSMTACGHTHHWEWQRSETEHWQVCTQKGCDAEKNRGTHEDRVCEDCAEFHVLALGDVNSSDPAHNDFVKEANEWFPKTGKELGYTYEYSEDFGLLNEEKLQFVDLVMFLNERPRKLEHQAAFENYMKTGGAWMGFHICAGCWATNKEDPEQYWKWFQDDFVGCGNHSHNTWNPTSEPMRVETYNYCATENLELENDTFVAAPCEWYAWEYDVSKNEDITVLLTLNPTKENPAGDSPGEIWTSGTYPIAWANNNYKMVYMNWGHNLQSYNNGEEGTSSRTFSSEKQNQFMIDTMFGLTK